MAAVAPRLPVHGDSSAPRQPLSRYRSLRKPSSQPALASDALPPMPVSAMAQAAASASLQRSQSRYHKPTSTPQAHSTPRTHPASHAAGQLRPPPSSQQSLRPPPLPQHRSTSPQAQKVRTQRSQPNVRQQLAPEYTNGPSDAKRPSNNTPTNFSRPQPNGTSHSSGQKALARSDQDAARNDTRRLIELEAHRQRQLQERLRAQRDAARQAGTRPQEQRSRDATAHMSETDRARKDQVRREALRLKAEADQRVQEARAAQKLEEERQDERIKILARQKYEEKEKERKEEERRQMLMDEQNRAAIEVKREEHRRKIEEKERKQEQKERKLMERESQKNLRAAMGPRGAVGGTGMAENKLTGSDSVGSKTEGRLRHVPTLRRRESDRPPTLKHKTSMEVFTGVFRRNSETVKPLETVGTKFEDVSERQQPIFIKKGGGGAVPGIDAPVSASNAGERRVLVQCGNSSMYLPVTPTTTPVDLIYSASNVMSEDINPSKSVLLEHFAKVGIQRPLRKYEHIRDVLNSWDDDKQNSLHLVPSATGGQDPDLEAATVVNLESPSDQTFLMYYSQKPGKWDKRYVTIRTDGQVVHAKKELSNDFSTICHMSDFDIYTPMPQALSKKINPPKKLCFGIKSQQKSAMFLTTEKFVHFFSTGDKATAAAWYTAIQGWRSWYLVNVMGEGQTSRLQPSSAATGLEVDAQTAFAQGDKRSSHYQLGSFKPLLDLDLFGGNSPNDNTAALTSDSTNANPQPHRSKTITQHRTKESTSSSLARADKDSTFASTGLLGQAYAQRQRELDAAAAAERADSAGPFTEGPSLLSEIDSALGRSTTRKGRGLIDNATTPASVLDPIGGAGVGQLRSRALSSTQHGRPRTSKDGGGGGGGDGSKPLLDLNSGSLFAGGSLLRQAEMEGKIKRDGVPVIERAKGFEISVETGEGR